MCKDSFVFHSAFNSTSPNCSPQEAILRIYPSVIFPSIYLPTYPPAFLPDCLKYISLPFGNTLQNLIMSLEALHFYVLKIRKLIGPVSITFFKHQCYRGFGSMWRPLLHCSFAPCFLTCITPALPRTFLCGLLVSPAHWDTCIYKSTVFYGIQLKEFSSRDMHSVCARHCEDTEWHSGN